MSYFPYSFVINSQTFENNFCKFKIDENKSGDNMGFFDKIRQNINESLDKSLDKKVNDILTLKDKDTQKAVAKLHKDLEEIEKKYAKKRADIKKNK